MVTVKPRPLTFPHAIDGQPTLDDIAALLLTASSVLVMCGAGVSVASGIPDFRTPGIGLYDNLDAYTKDQAPLPTPESIFSLDFFLRRPEPFYALAQHLSPGSHLPTLTHYFLRLLQQKKRLKSVWTQNIDCLEREAGLDPDALIEAHGSFAEATCLECKHVSSYAEIKQDLALGQVLKCQRRSCVTLPRAYIKPNIVFFGEALPERFFDRLSDFDTGELLIVLGTSLAVGPFNSLIDRVPLSCPRLLLNLELVGQTRAPQPRVRISSSSPSPPADYSDSESDDDGLWGESTGFDFDGRTGRAGGIRDVACLAPTDVSVRRLADLCGWGEELDELMRKGHQTLLASKEVPSSDTAVTTGLDKSDTPLRGVLSGEVPPRDPDLEKLDTPLEDIIDGLGKASL